MTPHPTNYSRPLRQMEHVADLATLAANLLPDVWPRICDGITGQPKAQNTDGDGPSSVLDERGVPMPRLSDPTGEANTRQDPARRDIDELRKIGSRMHRDIERFVAIMASHQARQANGYERMHTAENDPGCKSCSRLEVGGAPRWEPVHHNVTIHGEKHPVCQWCGRWVKDNGELPSREILQAHHDGKRITRRAS